MKNVYEFPQRDKSYDEASQWCARTDKGLSAAEEQELQQWMAEDESNRRILFEMTSLWDDMSVMSRLADLIPEPATRSRGTTSFMAIAASVLVAVIAGGWLFWSQGLDTEVTDTYTATAPESVYETQIGEQSSVVLHDGTQVVLNTNSRIEVIYTDTYRLLRLERGEIHVDVAHDKDRPLSVAAGDRIVQAVGTAFSVEITGDRKIELVVTEGEVRIGVRATPHTANVVVAPPVLQSSAVAVAAGEEVLLGTPDEDIVQVSPEEIAIKLSWREGNLIFRGETLEDAVAEVGRYTTIAFVILDEDLKKKTIGGHYRAGDVDGLLASLRAQFNVVHEWTDDGTILLTRL